MDVPLLLKLFCLATSFPISCSKCQAGTTVVLEMTTGSLEERYSFSFLGHIDSSSHLWMVGSEASWALPSYLLPLLPLVILCSYFYLSFLAPLPTSPPTTTPEFLLFESFLQVLPRSWWERSTEWQRRWLGWMEIHLAPYICRFCIYWLNQLWVGTIWGPGRGGLHLYWTCTDYLVIIP